jgi:NAD(P)-dependent dehydrogenase (short-subunit alcohol dehydrogenase family)
MAPKVWFITGTSKGFGRVWAEAALERGDKVAATARDTRTLDDLVARYGDDVLPLQLDSRRTCSARSGSRRRRCRSFASRAPATSSRSPRSAA